MVKIIAKKGKIDYNCYMLELTELANIFKSNKATLYTVGGFSRSLFSSSLASDIDVCGKLLPSEVVTLLANTKFKANVVNSSSGSVMIEGENRKYEYTTLRNDIYQNDGSHVPIKIKFVKTIREDYKRRDFTINAIYYDIVKNKFYDFCHGRSDLKNKILKTIKNPVKSFCADSLRILRLIRFSVDSELEIEKQTFRAAMQCAYLTKNLTEKKFFNEVAKIKNKEKGFELLREVFPWRHF